MGREREREGGIKRKKERKKGRKREALSNANYKRELLVHFCAHTFINNA